MGNTNGSSLLLRITVVVAFLVISTVGKGQCPCSTSTWINNAGVNGNWTAATTWTANSSYPAISGLNSSVCINGNVTLTGNLTTNGGGKVTVCGSLTIIGDANFSSNLTVNGTLTVTGKLTMTGGATFNNATVSVGTDLSIGSNSVTFNGNGTSKLTVGGTYTSNTSVTYNNQNIAVGGDMTITSNPIVLNGSGSNTLTVGGNLSTNTSFSVNGYLADVTKNVTVTSNQIYIGTGTAYSKLIVRGNLTNDNAINVGALGDLVVFGNWINNGGAITTVSGNMMVKGDAVTPQVKVTSTGNLLIYGNYANGNWGSNVAGNVVVKGTLTTATYENAPTGHVYTIGTNQKWGSTTTQPTLPSGSTIETLYNQYLNIFGLAPFSATIAFSPSSPVCAGTSVTYTATATGATSYKFYVNGSSTAAYSGTNSYYTYAPANGDVVSVTVSNGTSTATATASAIVVNALPSTPVLAATNICAGSSAALSITNGQSGYTYAWSVSYPYTLTSSGTSSPTLAVPSNSTLFSSTSAILLYPDVSVTVTSNGCSTSVSNTSQKLIVVYRIPVTGPPFHIGNSVAK